ncbi:ATP-binding protein [Aliarcobacter butzleri]|uniref:ATP-binding protein n=1 Tax=Aliarcobacter butzleri TaxID=28197 RepID=UPI0021B2FE53|nr:ATP-binding protein [Aliarcobacter butzleri]MCT7536669.1 ATP-binding protein [Aliarcobacter butzleri]MCT7623135.1 ATP-binding protein [Aliarcobacter butzleri]
MILNILDIDVSFIENYQKLTFASLDFFHFEWFPNLSSGQENLLFQFANFYSLILDRTTKKLKDNIFIFIDEGENTLHPNWQKKYIKYLVDFFSKNFTQKINLIFATHSPFILSDLPKENVIFLERYKEDDDEVKNGNQKIGNCKNATKNIELKTFGANIHTLLSDGFFMSDGLMGEFAKNKIEEIKKFYELIQKLQNKGKIKKELWKKSYEKRKTRFGNIQKIIGEPFLQTIIKNYLDELEILFNGKKEFLDKEIKRLEELRKELK